MTDTHTHPNPLFHHILVGYDGSENAKRALDYGIKAAQANDARLTVMSVVTDVSGLVAYAGTTPADLEEEAHEEVGAELAAAVAAMPPGLAVTTVIQHGRSGPRLAGYAASHDVDLVIVGNRGRGTLRSALLGSVTEHLIHAQVAPVLVIPADQQARAGADRIRSL